MRYSNYLATIAAINKGLFNKKLFLYIVTVLIQNSLNTFIRSLFWVNIINVTVFTENWNNIESCVYVSTVVLLPCFSINKSSAQQHDAFSQKFPNYGRVRISGPQITNCGSF